MFAFRLLRLLGLAVLLGVAAPATHARSMVVAAHPLASQAGFQILQQGGSAVDAAVATQMVLTLVEPQSSGIGGGAFLMHYRESDALLQAFDGRETAPKAADPKLFLKPNGQRMKWRAARQGGRSVGVPGTVRMLALAHQQHGKLPWADLFAPAIDLAENGFPVPERMSKAIGRIKDWSELPAAAAYLLDSEGKPWPPGNLLKNPALAETFRALAQNPDALNEGPIAAEIVQAVQGYAANPGLLTKEDLAGYQPKVREPVCGPYLAYRVCGMPPPSSGGPTVLMILGFAERFRLHEMDPTTAEWAHLFAEASRVAFADRNHYMADPDFVPQPTAGLIDSRYLDERAKLIDPAKASGKVAPGIPPEKQGGLPAPHAGLNEQGTSHVSILDAARNVVSMTTTIESSLGSRLMVGGFLLNNELTDFSFLPEEDGKPIANRVQSGKRPRSSMAPVIVFDRAGEPVLVAGSPGGSRIIGYTAGSVIRVLGNGMDPQQAVEARHIINRNTASTEVEAGPGAEDLAAALEALGHKVRIRGLTSGSHLIRITDQGLLAGVDPRREGMAAGD